MFSINIKRSVATVGVVAGFLAAAGPAGAQGGGADFRGDDTITQARTPQTVTMLDYMGSP